MGIVFTPAVCHINLAAIVNNFRKLGSPSTLMPVVKSDAYGHGLTEVAQALAGAGAQRFAVNLAGEGAILRQLGHRQAILLLMGCLCAADWEIALRYELMPAIGNFEELEAASALLARYPGKRLACALKADTGMSRLGFSLDEIGAVSDFIAQTPGLEPELVVSHLACADMPEQQEFTQGQFRLFDSFFNALAPRFPGLRRSLNNSAGALTGGEDDVARPGIALYGFNPMPGADSFCLEWGMSVSTPVIQIRALKPGQSVSYGRTFKADRPMRIAIVACGYATGFARNLSNRGELLVNGQRVRQIGRICMNMSCVDITGRDDVKVGDLAWIIGGDGDNPVTALEIADMLGTIPYEILCLMGSLNPRVYC